MDPTPTPTPDTNQAQAPSSQQAKTTIKCPHCGHEYEIAVQVPEPTETPKMTWQT